MNQNRNKSSVQDILVLFVIFFTLSFTFFTDPEKAAGQEKTIELKVVADQANIRLEPDISSIIIRQVPKGTILNATEKKESWYAVQILSKQGVVVSGYVHESLVTAIEPFPEEKIPPFIPKIEPTEPEEGLPISETRFSLSISAGGNVAWGGDLNTGIKGLADLYQDSLGVQGEGTIGSVHLGYVLGIDLFFPLTKMISWGLGAEYFQATNTSRVEYSQGASSSVLDVQPNIRAIPIHAFLAFSPIPQMYVKGGISYYLSRSSYNYMIDTDAGQQRWTGKANAGGLGLLGSIGYIKRYSETLSFFAEITGRLARIQGFTGKEEFQDFSGEMATEKGTLYLIDTQVLEDRTHSVLFIRETRPNEAGITGAEKARIDYSGISLKIGLRLQF